MPIKLLLFFLLLNPTFACSKLIYFIPWNNFDPKKVFYDPESERDLTTKPYTELRQALEHYGYEVKFTKNAKKLKPFTALFSMGIPNKKLLSNLSKYPQKKCIQIIYEPPVIAPQLYGKSLKNYFGLILTMFDNDIDNVTYQKFHFPQPKLKLPEKIPHFYEKKFCIMIVNHKTSKHPKQLYTERKNIIDFFENKKTNELDLYGSGWGGYLSWKGRVKSKWDTMKDYKFCICYENMKEQKGYVTEKIFDCFNGGCVPIYWGADNITEYVPKQCFIDRRDFQNNQELYDFLKTMHEKQYLSYIHAIDTFLKSPQADKFSTQYFINTILNSIKEIEQKS